jgi:RNA polymerase sigma factor (sigma-70 family)
MLFHGLVLSKRMARWGPRGTGLSVSCPPPPHPHRHAHFRGSAKAQRGNLRPARRETTTFRKVLISLRSCARPPAAPITSDGVPPGGGGTKRLAEGDQPGDSIQLARGFVMSDTGQRQSPVDGAGQASIADSNGGSEANDATIERLYDQHYRALVDYGRGFVSLHDAQDIVHTVFSRMLKRNPPWVGAEYARRALFLAVQREAIDQMRYRKRWDVVDPDQLPNQQTASIETDEAENHERLRRWILGSLDPRFSQVLLLRMDGLRVTEIAGALGLPTGTVKRRLHLARKKLHSAKEKVNLSGFPNVV